MTTAGCVPYATDAAFALPNLEVVLGFAATGPRWGTFNAGQLEDQAVEAFAALCDRAAAHDLLVATRPRPDGVTGPGTG